VTQFEILQQKTIDTIWTSPLGQVEIRYRAIRMPPQTDVRVQYVIDMLDSEQDDASLGSVRSKETLRQGLVRENFFLFHSGGVWMCLSLSLCTAREYGAGGGVREPEGRRIWWKEQVHSWRFIQHGAGTVVKCVWAALLGEGLC